MARRRPGQSEATEESRRKGLDFARAMAQYIVWLSPADGVERPEPKEMAPEEILVLADDFPDHPLTASMREGAEAALGRIARMRDPGEREADRVVAPCR